MDLLVISDTHGKEDRLTDVLRRSRADGLLFLGDGLRDLSVLPEELFCRAVRGNCDFFGRDVPETRLETFGAYRIFMTHGHRYGVKYSPEGVIAAALAADADVALYGHTHLPELHQFAAGTVLCGKTLARPFTVMCPGSLGDPRDGAPTFGTLTLRDGGILPAIGQW